MFETFLVQPIYNIFIALVGIVPQGDAGLAIIALTLIMRLVLYPVFTASIRTQMGMTAMQGDVELIKEKHKDDKEALAREQMALFKKHKVKDRKRMRWVFSSRFTSGSRGFLLDLHGALRKIVNGGFIMAKKKQQKVSGHELVFSHRDSLALFKFMYNNGTCNHFLKRKYRLFKRAVETLYGVRS